ncbi:hypothetical protein AVEN_23335-1 [Araneus ventricosus]|uniref:STPR domain-containing protein n=1 Tax=Araneus ventricosus TaxID=182803 RepID=A0A4Y2FS02_ARAVE|nr:hypothetical protein AVEN_23335-1 [Araneus ventricosus]
MLPVDGRQLENVKGELLKLKKKKPPIATMAQRGKDRRMEETEEQRNSQLSDMAQRGQERRAKETEEQRKENTFWGERNVYVSDNICKKINRKRAYEN